MATKASGSTSRSTGTRAAAKAAAASISAPTPAIDQVAAKAYDALPYQSKPFAQSTPEQLSCMARLFKVPAPDVATARVLELGCASGGNLIPLAVRFPRMKAVGVDISKVQVEQGKIQLVRLGLENCELRCEDIAQAAQSLAGQFDYIICHGVFSWVPESVRHAIMQIVQDRLSPNGVAYISYNVYPGWKFREVIRDMMMFHAGGLEDMGQRLGQAKAILDYIKNITPETSTYGKMLRDEAGILSRVSDDYLAHEHLEANNAPMYFREFVQMASQHQLSYLGEAFLSDMAPQRLGNDVYQTLSRLSAGNILATEQYMDFFTNRTFRQTLLVRQDVAPQVDRNISPRSLGQFMYSTAVQPDPNFRFKAGEGVLGQFVDGAGRTLTVRAPFALSVIRSMVDAKPYTVSLDDIMARCRKDLPELVQTADEPLRDAICGELLNLLLQNLLRLHQVPLAPPAPVVAGSKPKAFALARVQAEGAQTWVSNLQHVPVGLSAGHKALLALMDGRRDLNELRAGMVAQFRDGRLSAHRAGEAITDPAQLEELANLFLQQALGELRGLALLV